MHLRVSLVGWRIRAGQDEAESGVSGKHDDDVAYDGLVHVRGAQCKNCLFTPNRLVEGSRARELVEHTRGLEGSSFICHRSQVSDEPTSICRGWWDHFAMEDSLFKLVTALGLVTFIEVGGEGDEHG